LKAKDLIPELKRRLGLETNRALARALGMSEVALFHWMTLKKPLTPRRVANAIYKARQSAIKQSQLLTIRPIVELFPLDTVESSSGLKFELFPTARGGTRLNKELREQLSKSHGIYIFYDSRGRAMYVGKAKKQSLWTELKFAFNRDRTTQKVFRVKHPTRSQAFSPAFKTARQPRATQLSIGDFAAFVSVYEVDGGMVDDLEALLVRGFANDLLNRKMERFAHSRAPTSKKAKGRKRRRPRS
jgi:hypothetical protein